METFYERKIYNRYFEYVGNMHIHSTYSDGTKSIEDIARIAQKSGLDFICFNDHNTLEGLHDRKEDWYEEVLVLIGTEVNKRYNHYLAYDVYEVIPESDINPQQVIDEVNRQGGFGFIAHPFEKGSPLIDGGHGFTWNDWTVDGYVGMSIWDYSSDWKGKAQSILSALYYYYNPGDAIRYPNHRTLEKWDEESMKRKIVAIGDSDAHDYTFKRGPFSWIIFPYRFLFKAINTHILLTSPLTGNFKDDKLLVYSALKRGNCFVSNDRLGDSRGFRFFTRRREKEAIMGEEVELRRGMVLNIESPKKAIIRLMRNGKRVKSKVDRVLRYEVSDKGVYRVELLRPGFFKKEAAWVFSNPIYVR
ncbi:MAG: CehA/McbA family metallohydrolase [Thermodesulfobacteriota bacterium]|nr:CehA/McbA family metallohydrolase [Thermodesulfobacteriota bacterium]